MKQVSALFFCLMMTTMSLTGCLGDDSDSESSTDVDESPLTMYSVSDSIEGNVSEVWFTVNSTVEQALKIESLYISYCSPTDDDGDDPNTSEEEEYPYACDFSRTSLEVNSTCNGASIKLVANASILILDEATNSLDDKTEESFFEVLSDLNKQLTIISINYKLNNKSFFDHIYHFNKKNLVKVN